MPSAVCRKPIVSVIIVSYNTRDLTLTCLKHLYASTGIKASQIEVVVVDNHSSDGTVAAITKSYPNVRLIVNQNNMGFGRGNNQGVAASRGKYLLLLNTDAYLDHDTLSLLIQALESSPQVLAVGPRYFYQDGSFQQSVGYFPSLARLAGWMWGLDKLPLIKSLFSTPYHVCDPAWYHRARPVDWLMGACVLLKHQDYLQVAGFDEKIFMYAEEVEFFLRLTRQSRRHCYFVPSARIIHLGSASTKKALATRLLHELQGIEYIYAKHFPQLLWIIRFIVYTGVIMRIALFSLIPHRADAVLEYKKYFKNTT